MKIKIFLFLLLLSDGFCGLAVNAKLVNKKGIDKGFVLETETHFVQEFSGTKKIQVRTKDGINIELTAAFVEEDKSYGPSDKVVFQGEVFDKAGNHLEIFGKGPFVLKLGEEKKFESTKWKGQLLEITLKPEIN